jgi:hypothetical protein
MTESARIEGKSRELRVVTPTPLPLVPEVPSQGTFPDLKYSTKHVTYSPLKILYLRYKIGTRGTGG